MRYILSYIFFITTIVLFFLNMLALMRLIPLVITLPLLFLSIYLTIYTTSYRYMFRGMK